MGFKVVVILPEGKKSHFVVYANNFAGRKQATDDICKLYAKKGLIVSPTANFFDDHQDYNFPPKDHLANLSPEERCWCGWWKHGECSMCPDELSFADNKRASR
jgi:competence transcription factor ComK